MFRPNDFRPLPTVPYAVFVFKNEMVAFGWKPHNPGWIVPPSHDPTNAHTNTVWVTEDELIAARIKEKEYQDTKKVHIAVATVQSKMNEDRAHIEKIEEELIALRRQCKQTQKEKCAVIFFADSYDITYLIMDADFVEFDECYINWVSTDLKVRDVELETERQARLTDMLYNDKGLYKQPVVSKKAFVDCLLGGGNFAVCGFIE